MRVWALLIIAACGASPPPQRDQPGPPGTWTCKQIVESCDSMCRTGMCLNACSNEGSQEGGSLHAALIQCAAQNRCYDAGCTRAVCGPQVDACMAGGLPPVATAPQDNAPPPPMSTAPPPPPIEQQQPQPQPPPHVEDKQPPPAPADPALTGDALAGDWSYGTAKAGGSIKFASDGRFERETHAGGKSVTHDAGGWKLDGSTLVLTIAGGKPERRAVRMASKTELAITDDSGELQSYRKKR
ncbi:MAG: hypothetical protein QM831_23165 [Kofleriaceae bacterium]